MGYYAVHVFGNRPLGDMPRIGTDICAYLRERRVFPAKFSSMEILNNDVGYKSPRFSESALQKAIDGLADSGSYIRIYSPRPSPAPEMLEVLIVIQNFARDEPGVPHDRGLDTGGTYVATVAVRSDRAEGVLNSPQHWLDAFWVLRGLVGYLEVDTQWEQVLRRSVSPRLEVAVGMLSVRSLDIAMQYINAKKRVPSIAYPADGILLSAQFADRIPPAKYKRAYVGASGALFLDRDAVDAELVSALDTPQ